MKRNAEDDLVREAKRPKLSDLAMPSMPIDYDLVYTSIIPALVHNNDHIFDQRNKDSVRALFYEQCEKYSNHLIMLLKPHISESSRQNFTKFIAAKGALGVDFLRDNFSENIILYFIGLQYFKSVSIFDKSFNGEDEKKNIESIMDFIEWKNTQLNMVALFAFLPSFEKPASIFNPEIKSLIDIFSEEINELEKLKEISSSAHKIIYPFYPFTHDVEKVRDCAMSEVFKIIMQHDADEQALATALALYGNLLREKLKEEEFKYILSFDKFVSLCAKYCDNYDIVENLCFGLRNIIFNNSMVEDKNQYKAFLVDLFKHPNPKVILWASRAYGTILVSQQPQEAAVSLEEIYKLFYHQNEEVAAWAFSFVGTFVACPTLTPTQIPSQSSAQVMSFLRYQINQKDRSAKVIESALWCLGNLLLKEKMEQIPEEVLYFIDANILSAFPNGEKLILFAGRCISNLNSSNAPSKIPLSPAIFNKLLALIDTDNEKIAVWAICFLGTVSSNALDYNISLRKHIASSASILRKLFDLVDNHHSSPKIMEAILWSFHKIMWCEESKNSLRLLGLEKLIVGFLAHPSDKINDKIIEGSLLCFGDVATQTTIQNNLPSVVKYLRSSDKQVKLVACRTLNTLVTATTANHQINRQILGEEEGLIEEVARLLYERDPLVLESASWCLGNLALRSENVEKIYALSFDKIFELIYLSNPLYLAYNIKKADIDKIVEGVCFLFCNLAIESTRCHDDIARSCGDIISLLFSLLETHSAGHYKFHNKVIEAACWALHKSWCPPHGHFPLPDHYGLVEKNEGFEKIVSLLKHEDNKVLAGACWCIGKSLVHGGNTSKARSLELDSLLFNIMKRKDIDPKLILLTLRCVGTLCVNLDPPDPVYLEEIGEHGMQTMLALLGQHVYDDNMIETCVWAIASLLNLPGNRSLFLAHDGFTQLRLFYALPRSSKTIEGILHIFSNMYLNDQMLSLVNEADIDYVIKFLNHSDVKIGENARRSLDRLVGSGTYGKHKSAEPGLALLLDLLREHRGTQFLFAKTCGRILSSLWISHENRALFVKYEGFNFLTKNLDILVGDNNIKNLLLLLNHMLLLDESMSSYVAKADVAIIAKFKDHTDVDIAEYAKRSLRVLHQKGLYHGAL
jgi:hypothetical protein